MILRITFQNMLNCTVIFVFNLLLFAVNLLLHDKLTLYTSAFKHKFKVCNNKLIGLREYLK